MSSGWKPPLPFFSNFKVSSDRQKRAELREYKKKKALKKKEKMEKVEVFREKEKERWKSFTHKVLYIHNNVIETIRDTCDVPLTKPQS